ncbi:MAG: hypothetical protein ACRD3O_20130, partial [Terriglobia bacterium]
MNRAPYITRREFMEESFLAATAALIPGTTHQAKVIPINAKRAQVTLDGIWRFIPALGGEGGPPAVGWGHIKVPGSWATRRGRDRSYGLVARGSGPQWEHYDGGRSASAWYERQVSIPLEW